MFRLGLTGSIATGKTTVLSAFAALGVPVASADDIVHELYAGEAVEPVAAAFPGVVSDGVIDRARLMERILRDGAALARLEAIVHPMVRRRIADFLSAAEAAGEPLAVIDVPLLFESGHAWGFDAIAVTFCDPETQRLRALARPGMTVEKLEAILARQLPQAEKKARAAYVFDTSRPLRETQEMVKALVEAIRARPDGIE